MTFTSNMLTFITALMLLFFTNGSAFSDSSPTVEEIVAHYVTAIGGADKVASVKGIIIRGIYSEKSFKIDATLSKMRPYYKLVGDPYKRSKDFEEGYDGSAWEFYGNPGIVVRTVTEASKATRHSTSVLGSLADYRAEGSTVTLSGIENIDGHKTWRIRLQMRDGYEQDEFIDANSWLLIAERKVAPIHAVGEPVKSETRFSDFRTIDGVTISFTNKEVEIATGKMLNQFIVKEILINPNLEPANFSPPIFPRSESQNLIETLFIQRDDPMTVLWTMFDFRRAHPDISTDVLSRISGYQMVKTGQLKSAIALLKQNTMNYPQSAAAASSLGRAYGNAGDLANALIELNRSLSIDPNDKHTREARDKLKGN